MEKIINWLEVSGVTDIISEDSDRRYNNARKLIKFVIMIAKFKVCMWGCVTDSKFSCELAKKLKNV